jgi:AcrR family transcriptional regulator
MQAKADDGHIKRERRKQARPGELLDAALALFVEKGFAATRVEEVAARAGVSKGTLFLYFDSKEELFKAVVHDNLVGRFVEWNEEFERFEGNSADMLRTCLSAWWERIGATPASGITKLMISESHNFPELASYYQNEVMVPGQALIRRILQRGVDRGEFRVSDMDYAIYSVIAPMIFLMMNKHSLGTCVPAQQALDPLRFIAMQTDVLLHGLCTRASSDEGSA